MRSIPLILVAGTILASCTMAPPSPEPTMASQQRLEALLAGKVAQPPISCVNTSRASSPQMSVINENTIAFRDGRSRVYVAHTTGCNNLSQSGSYALVTKQYGGFGLCQGDIAQVRDLGVGVTVGSCAITDITLYATPGR